jgi:hypothetical protein
VRQGKKRGGKGHENREPWNTHRGEHRKDALQSQVVVSLLGGQRFRQSSVGEQGWGGGVVVGRNWDWNCCSL